MSVDFDPISIAIPDAISVNAKMAVKDASGIRIVPPSHAIGTDVINSGQILCQGIKCWR